MKQWRKQIQRICAMLLSVILFLTGVPVPVFAKQEISSYLDGWTVQAAWSTLSRVYQWESTEESVRQPKMVITYRIDHAQKDYPAGSLIFTVPGIGAANRSKIIKTSHLAADEADSEWDYEWNQEQDFYTFTNRFAVEKGQSVSGGFELLWSLNSRELEDGFTKTESPIFAVQDVGAIKLEPLTFQFHSVRDRYRIELSRDKLYDEEYETADSGFIWYELTTRFDKDWMSRGLYKSDYYVKVELPDGMDVSDVRAKREEERVELQQDADGNWGFYPFRGRSGDLGGHYYSHYDRFTLGFRKETLTGQEITIHGHLDRLYHDESEWTTGAGANEVVDAELTFTVEDYHFSYNGYIYDHDKWNTEYENYGKSPYYYNYDYGDEKSHDAPPIYGERLNAVNLYNGKIVQFTLRGKANRSYASEQAAVNGLRRSVMIASDSNAISIPDDMEDWNDIHWREHGLGMEEDVESGTGLTYGERYPGMSATWSNTQYATGADAWKASGSNAGVATSANAELDDDEFGIGEIFLIPDILIRGIREVSSWLREKNPFRITAYASTATPANARSISQIGENQEYSLVMGDDKIALFLNNGSIRHLEDYEYDMAYVTIPADEYGFDYEVYGADTQNMPMEAYQLIGGGNTSAKQTIHLPEGIKAVFVRVNGVIGTYCYHAYVGVRLHLDWAKQQELEAALRPDHENRLVNFSYMQSLYLDEYGYEHNDCLASEVDYGGIYGDVLSELDESVYGGYLERDYSNVWLRSAVTNLTSEVKLDGFEGGGRAGFTSSITSKGRIMADNAGSLERFSVYTVIPDGVSVRLDEAEILIEGAAHDIFGSEVTNFADYVVISSRAWNGKQLISADFDCSESPLEIGRETMVSLQIPVSLSYDHYLEYGNQYTAKSYLMVHDDGLDRISGKAILSDEYDVDEDQLTEERMAYAADVRQVTDQANEWREYVSKSVKSAYSDGYVQDTVTRIFVEDDIATKEKSLYSYRLEFGLGSDHARNIIFYDRLEQGAILEKNEGTENVGQKLESQWQGEFVSIDTSYALRMGMLPTVYYSENAGQEFDLSAEGWSTQIPSDRTRVKSIAVMLDTTQMPDGMMKNQQMTYVTLHMRAPSDLNFCDKKAVNQYTVQYDAYGLTDVFEQTYQLSSAETTVRLLDTVGKIVFQKVDADHLLWMDEDGTKHYSSVTGARFQIYDCNGNAMFSEAKELSSLGRIAVKNVPYGTYYWEEVEAPPGYERITGLHAFEIDGVTEVLEIPNQRIPGVVTLIKQDLDAAETILLPGAVFELYQANGNQVFTDAEYVWSEYGRNSTFQTDQNGQLTVRGLPWGSYYFAEVEAPAGYHMNTDKIHFTLGKGQYDERTDTVHTEVTAYNAQKTASITLKKLDAQNQKPIKNAVFSLYRESEQGSTEIAVGLKTNAAGEIQVDDLKFGTYYFTETRNAGGYQMPVGDDARTDSVTLNASTAEKNLEITYWNDRRLGTVQLVKTDQTGLLVGGAEYGLFYRSEEETEYRLYDTYRTESDQSRETFGEIWVKDLPWGDYYFLETKAPKGYELSSEVIGFSIDQESSQNVLYLETQNQLKKGSVRLVKTDLHDQSLRLSGAVYELYRLDGTKCMAGVDYSLPEGVPGIETGTDGSVLLMDIQQGAYYLKEIQAPESYSISDTVIRFSVTKENVDTVQELIAADEKGKAVITIRKEINEVYEAFGNPTFVFEICGDDGSQFFKAITLDEKNLRGEVTLEVNQGVLYTVSELPSARYRLQEVIVGENAKLNENGEEAVLDLITNTKGEVTFINQMEQYEKFSHTGHAVNLVSDVTKLTSVSVSYEGEDPLTMNGSGYDMEEEEYRISKENLIVKAHYDDGTSRELNFDDYVLSPETVNGFSDSYTGTVFYTENGIRRTASFSVEIDLPQPLPRHTISFELNGGTIVLEGENSALEHYSYTAKQGTQIFEPVNEPVLEGYRFEGWYLDEALITKVEFPETAQGNQTYYAKWEEVCVKVRYAVSIYGIQEDVDADGNTVGLTFGPATGDSYVDNEKRHDSEGEDQICMHDLTWEEIIGQSKIDPTVFQECLERGCTHGVELKIKGPLMEGGTSYQDMTGDGTGMLYHSLNPDYLKWNRENSAYFTDTSSYEYRYGTNLGGWPDSAMRNTLNGTVTENMLTISNKDNGFAEAKLDESTALIAWFPEELRETIVAKQVKSDTVYDNTSNCNVITYDKLWLFSGIELMSDVGSGTGRNAIRPNEGVRYSRQDIFGITTENGAGNIAYQEDGSVFNRWSRSLYPSLIAAYNAFMINQDGFLMNNSVRTKYGIAPGFCIPGPDNP